MKSFFKGMNLARGIILVTVIGAVGLGALGYAQSRKLAEMQEQHDQNLEPLVKTIQDLGRKHTHLSKSMRQEGLAGQSDPISYIRKIATKDKVDIGDVKVTSSEDVRTRGIVDYKYRIRPQDRDRQYMRSRIANFLYSLEADSRRVKVTDLTIELAQKKIKPHEIPEDMWTFEAEITSRQRVDEPAAATTGSK
jgi:hypothetical protein